MNIFKKDELKLLWPIYISILFGSILFLYPIFYVLYFREIGFSLTQIGFLASAFFIANILFEIPTGVIADLFGRKFSVITGYILAGIAMTLIMFSNNFYIILALFFLRGIFRTLTSGADEAWIVDFLRHKKRKDLIHEYYTKQHSFMSFGMVLSGIIGSFLVGIYGLWLIFPITGITMILSAIITIFQSEYFVVRKTKIKNKIKELINHANKSISYLRNNNPLLLLFYAGILTTIALTFTNELTWYPLLQNLGFKTIWFGYLISASFIIEIILPYFIKPIVKLFGGYKNYLIIVISFQAILILSVLFAKNMVLVIILYSIIMPLYSLWGIASSVLFQHIVKTKIRATIGSVFNMSTSAMSIILIPVIFLYINIKSKNIPKL